MLPAFTPREREVALPLMLDGPVPVHRRRRRSRYFVVLPRAIDFLQNFNDDTFDILVQAQDYYKFVDHGPGAMGLLFQIPVGDPRRHARWASSRRGSCARTAATRSSCIAVVAALAPRAGPGDDALAMAPLFVLYEALSCWRGSSSARAARAARREEAEDDDDDEDDDARAVAGEDSDGDRSRS